MAPLTHSIAVIEDNTDLNGILVHAIRSSGFVCDGFASVEAFARSGQTPQIFLLDLNLPGEDGLSFARRLRSCRPAVGIVMLTARTEMEQRKHGYDSGADVYLTKPSSVDEILGALNALARRMTAQAMPAESVEMEQILVLSPRKLLLEGPAGSVSVNAGEAALLARCAADPEGRISLDAFNDLTPDGAHLSKVAIELKIVRLRKKLAAVGFDGRSISSVRNFGYQMLVPIRVSQG